MPALDALVHVCMVCVCVCVCLCLCVCVCVCVCELIRMKTCILDSSTGSYHFDPGLVYIRIGEQRVIAIFEYNTIKLEPEITSQYIGLHMANQAYC